MIISDYHRFAFVHIPKNAGTSIRAQLARIDERNGYYAARREGEQNHIRDYCHLTLAQLDQLYPEELERLQAYTTFCVLRDPVTRFNAAVAEYAKQELRRDISTFSLSERLELINDVIKKLNDFGASELPYWLVWFTPQAAFIEHRGQRFVSHIFPINDLSGAFALIREKTGISLDTHRRKNQSVAFSGNFSRIAARIGRHARCVLGEGMYTSIRHSARAILLLPLADSDKVSPEEMRERDTFVKDFYFDDYSIWREALANARENFTGG
ncbi:MAG: sulfotransferase family 2 domain-containing protein [Balneolaceae bacterium]|nr:sulfotransferase family 2 domain-containing protein [Balneolaceae bacterium]